MQVAIIAQEAASKAEYVAAWIHTATLPTLQVHLAHAGATLGIVPSQASDGFAQMS